MVQDTFNTCAPIDSGDKMTQSLQTLESGMEYLAMINYPYATSFLRPVPANPVSYGCKAAFDGWPAADDKTDQDYLTALKTVADVYFNYEGEAGYCYDMTNTDASGDLDAAGWDVLACNQLAMPISKGSADKSMFVPQAWDEAAYS